MSEKCEVKNGLVTPCETLDKATDHNGHSKSKGTHEWNYYKTQTGEQSSSYFGVKTKEFPDGLVFNFCPFCGTRLR